MFDLSDYCLRLLETEDFLVNKIGREPFVGIITGTGLGNLLDKTQIEKTLPYKQIPNFPVSTVSSHPGQLATGKVETVRIVVLNGRFHLYEGYDPWEIVFPIRALVRCGMRGLVITNAAGGLAPGLQIGDIMMLTDHVNLTGESPLAGPHNPDFGPRFPDMSQVYDPSLRALTKKQAEALGIPLETGVYAAVKGPSLETPAETRFFGTLADAIGMSTVLEAAAAVQAKIRTLAFSVITNVNDPDNMKPTSLQDVVDAAGKAAPRLATVIRGVCANWPEDSKNE